MSVTSSGLASLTATYTDSEGEDEQKDDDSPSPKKSGVSIQISQTKLPSRVARLVSYHDDADDDGAVDAEASEAMTYSKVIIAETENREIPKEDVVMFVEDQEIIEEEDENDVKLPPEPSGKCSAELQEKITHLYQRMKSSVGFDMNEIIQNRKAFRNPSIYEKLIQYCGINELGTNYPPNIYNPELWGKESFYEELARVQKAEMDKREKDRKEKTKVEFVSGTAKRITTLSLEDDKKRKSKWDQVGGLAAGAISAPSLLRTAGLTQPPALGTGTSSSGTKATVISAFGSLPKKPRV